MQQQYFDKKLSFYQYVILSPYLFIAKNVVSDEGLMLHNSQQKYTTISVPSLKQIGNTKNWRYEFNVFYGFNDVTRF
jgi:hypothetical protein